MIAGFETHEVLKNWEKQRIAQSQSMSGLLSTANLKRESCLQTDTSVARHQPFGYNTEDVRWYSADGKRGQGGDFRDDIL